ncbi:MAG: DNA cytosine methyltransferase [Clostridia bacterium]|nr:DNA cytosine methyltransferase [Clostridia bacterium]
MRVVDLFCGCGGMSLGFQKAGFDVVAAYDNWDPAVNIYKLNFSHPVIKKNLMEDDSVENILQFRPEMIVGGPPCQDFSISGKRNFEGKRANLTTRFAEIVSSIKPQWFVMENVYNIEKSPVLPAAIETLRNAGYGMTKRVLDASFCGVPQARKRFFLIGHLGDDIGALDDIINTHLSAKRMTVYDYLGNSLNTEYYYMHPRNYSRRAVFSIHEPSATIRGINRPIPLNYKKHPADKADISDEVRCLTTKERSYIQTFPDSFRFDGAKTDVELAIGNAVPVNLAKYVGMCIAEYIAKSKKG